MAVAELLANSSRVLPEDLRHPGKRPHSAPDGGSGGGGGGGGAAGLRITNPDDLLGSASVGATAVAHTPWDGEVSEAAGGGGGGEGEGRKNPNARVFRVVLLSVQLVFMIQQKSFYLFVCLFFIWGGCSLVCPIRRIHVSPAG